MNILGIDLGHCETTAAAPRETTSGYVVSRIDSQQHEQVIVTQLVLTNEQMKLLKGNKTPSYSLLSKLGEIKIGNHLPVSVVNGEKFIYFKVPPKDFDNICANTEVGRNCGITHGMVMACYAYALIKSIFRYNGSDWAESNINKTELLVGCPSTTDWTSKSAKEKYAQLIKNATGVKSVEIIPESRAAMFSSVENGGNRVSAVKGAIVFDFGSSTADCTYMLLGRKMLEFSWTLGASEIERRIVQQAFVTAQREQGAVPDVDSFVESENIIREAKESYYNGAARPVFCVFKDKNNKNVYQQIMIGDDFMNRIVEEEAINIQCNSMSTKTGSWASLCKEFFNTAKYELAKANAPIDTIVLTGGASKMGFVYDLCCKVFSELPKSHIMLEPSPSHTVANGLGWVSRADQKVIDCKSKAKTAINKDDSCGIAALKNAMRESVYKLVCDVVKTEATAWGDLPGEHSARELLNRIETRTKSEQFQRSVNDAMSTAIKNWKGKLSDSIAKAVNTQVRELYSDEISRSFILPIDIWEELNKKSSNNNSINVNDALGDIDLTPITNKIISVIIGAIIWGIAIALAIETFGISLAVGFVLDVIKEAALENQTLKNQIDKKRPQTGFLGFGGRKAMASKIIEELSNSKTKTQMLNEMDTELDAYSKKYESVIDDILTKAFEIVTLKRFDTK